MPTVSTKLEYWKNRLLDLGKRNRLINCPLPKDGKRVQRHSLLISIPTPIKLYTLLCDDDKALSFPVPPKQEEGDIQYELFTVSNEIVTNQSPNESYKTLRSLMKKAKEFEQEKGLNALYLAFGFLNWVDNGIEGQDMRSPLLLLPVKLVQDDLFSPILLSQSDEEVTTNYSLEQKLFNDFGIELPKLSEDISLHNYLSSVEQAVASLGWHVSNDATQLSLFSFMKINMYLDLDRNAEKICGHHLVRAINGEVTDDGVNISDISEYNHDNDEPQDTLSVVDADSSQQDAILLAKRGTSFILQGPPGTGKSQTITNIIAELIAEGKKVLFVSEKMAALEVVYKRLTQVGLAPFCLTLHSHNAKRREILDQFDKSIKMSRQKVNLQQDAYNHLFNLKVVRNALNQYSAELHTPVEPLGKTIYQVNGYLSQLDNYRNIDYVQKDVKKYTPELFAKCESALEELTRIVSMSGYQEDNPWNGCKLSESPTYEFRQRFLVDSEKLVNHLNNGIEIYADLNKILGANINWKYAEIENVREIYDIVKVSPKTNSSWIDEDLVDIKRVIKRCAEAINSKSLIQFDFDASSKEITVVKACIERNERVVYDTKSIIPDVVAAYHKTLDTYNQLSEQINNYEDSISVLSKNKSICEEKCKDERARFEINEREWQLAQDSLFAKCSENLLTLDIPMILAHYRSEFRSALRRLSGDYRQNRMAILSYCKVPGKITYEQQLTLLEEADNALKVKAAYEKQSNVLLSIENEHSSTKAELDDICVKYDESKASLLIETVNLQKKKEEVLSAIEEMVSDYQEKIVSLTKKIDDYCRKINDILGEKCNDTTNYQQLLDKIQWCLSFKNLAKTYSFGKAFINECCDADTEMFKKIDSVITHLQKWHNNITPDYDKFLSLFTYAAESKIKSLSLKETSSYVTKCRENFESLEYLIDYRVATKQLKELGIDIYLNKAIEHKLVADEIIPVYKKCFYRSWLDAIIPNKPVIREFRRLRQDERISTFMAMDKSHLEVSKAIVISKLISRLPNFDTFSANGEIALLRREMAKQRKLMPTRLLIAALPNLLPVLKPCIMMSPLSVSTYLGSSNFEFDAVIFDEASQVRTEDAIGAGECGKISDRMIR